MFRNLRPVLCIILIISSLLVSACFSGFAETTTSQTTVQQQNAINMCNYLRALAQEIQSSANNRLLLENAYSTLYNNTHPNSIDQLTLDEVLSLVDTLNEYRMISVKRDRLDYIHEQNTAQAFREAVPHPLSFASAVSSNHLAALTASVAYMSLDVFNKYQTAVASIDLEYVQSGWELSDQETEILHNCRKDLYAYMINMVTSYSLDGSLILSEDMVDDFVTWKNNDNVIRKIQFFEANHDVYQAFGPYWLALAEAYYDNGDYTKCLESISAYEALDIHIFRYDHDYAKILPLAISAAKESLSKTKYVSCAEKYLVDLQNNAEHNEWSLLYFASQTYIDLFNETGNTAYLTTAYDIALNNVNILAEEQRSRNKQYIAEILTQPVPKGSSKNTKKEIEAYNKSLKELRKTELPPASEALLLNCDLLFFLAEQLNINNSETAKIESILRNDGEVLFYTAWYENDYSLDTNRSTIDESDINIVFSGKELSIPVQYVTPTTTLAVQLSSSDVSEYTDWTLQKVVRENTDDVTSFIAVYRSNSIKDYSYQDGEIATIILTPQGDNKYEPLTFEFQASRNKRVDGLDNWGWLDDATKWSDAIQFSRIASQ